jgi:predicted AAA+ superfamily ATPase
LRVFPIYDIMYVMKSKKPEIYIERKFDKTLLAWKSRDNRLPLIVEGARQVGKSD